MIRIYSKNATPPEQMFFDLNGDDYAIVNDENEEFEFALDRVDKKCKMLCFQIWHNHENQETVIPFYDYFSIANGDVATQIHW